MDQDDDPRREAALWDARRAAAGRRAAPYDEWGGDFVLHIRCSGMGDEIPLRFLRIPEDSWRDSGDGVRIPRADSSDSRRWT